MVAEDVMGWKREDLLGWARGIICCRQTAKVASSLASIGRDSSDLEANSKG